MFALLIKPAALRKRKYRKVLDALEQAGANRLQSKNTADLKNEIKALAESHENLTVVACGGDGTVNLAINAIVDLPVQFGVVPMGTGNDFARHIGVFKIGDSLQAFSSGKYVNADLGMIQLQSGEVFYYAAVASCGFDAQVNEKANQIQGPNGPIKYLWSVFSELKNLSPLNLSLMFNGEHINRDFSLIAIGNTSSYGGGMYITPNADLHDGTFDCTIVNSVSRRELVKVLPRVFSGSHVKHPAVSIVQTSEIEILGNSYPIYADGERIGVGPAKFKVSPARLRLLVPNNI